jgi:hypothetical protein
MHVEKCCQAVVIDAAAGTHPHWLDIQTAAFLELPGLGANTYLIHYWADSVGQLFEKHARYIKEGESRYVADQRFSWKRMLYGMYSQFVSNLITRKGIRGGFTGIFLSLFATWYALMSWLSLRRYQYRLHVSTTRPEV